MQRLPRTCSNRLCVRIGVLGCTLIAAAQAFAHEVRPGFLHLAEQSASEFSVLWKQPVQSDRRLPLEPQLPPDCAAPIGKTSEHTGDALLQRWRTRCDLRTGAIAILGLSRTLTDVMVQVDYLDGDSLHVLLRPEKPVLDLSDPSPPVWDYLYLGVEHLLTGIDHILFVTALVLYIRGFWALLKAVTAFTLAHSITLALSVLEWVRLPAAPVEAVIALSIVFLGRELVLPEHRRSRITSVRPWIMAFAFGLLHGFGFAGALADIGLPKDQLAVSLFLFNLGIELGQLLIVAVMLAFLWLAAKKLSRTALVVPAGYAVGSLAAFWTLQRSFLI